ncbi:hypothetical protein [Alloscardovia sp. HMSC034E08]|nr:hypothetical protein [Alloscardovia sp. HMSC034E08]
MRTGFALDNQFVDLRESGSLDFRRALNFVGFDWGWLIPFGYYRGA